MPPCSLSPPCPCCVPLVFCLLTSVPWHHLSFCHFPAALNELNDFVPDRGALTAVIILKLAAQIHQSAQALHAAVILQVVARDKGRLGTNTQAAGHAEERAHGATHTSV